VLRIGRILRQCGYLAGRGAPDATDAGTSIYDAILLASRSWSAAVMIAAE